MEPNMKLLIEELMKEVCGEIQSLQKEMKDGFSKIAAHEVAVNNRISPPRRSSTRSALLC
jgi:hypothetical protein